jgi:catechol 2,3-dioxygenase
LIVLESEDKPSYGIQPPAFRLPDTTHVGSVHLQVTDIQRSIAYYDQVIGLRASNVTAASARLSGSGDDPPLVVLETRSGVTPARRGAFGLYHFAILLPDRAALGRFAAHLSTLGARVGMADHSVSESFYLWDPDGLGIEVYADRPRAGWQRSGRELVLRTDPLDLPSVVAEGGGVSWNGAPPGTRLGHVHLHVGDLGVAEAFYHRALGLDKISWSYPGALFLAAGGYHHHLGTNIWSSGPSSREHEARLLRWELIVPSTDDVTAAGRSLQSAGYQTANDADGLIAADPWGTRVQLRV